MNVFKMSKSNILKKVMMLLVVLVTTAMFIRVNAETSYPFRTGDDALKNAPTWIGATESQDHWQFLQTKFDTIDLSDSSKDYYVAVEIAVPQGNPGLTYGLIDTNGNRYGTFDDSKDLYKVTEDGTVTPVDILYSAGNLGNGFKGMVVMPLSSMVWQTGSGSLTTINSVYFTTNALYNRDFKVTVGEIGIYEGDFRNGGKFTKIKDLSESLKEDSYYKDPSVLHDLVFPTLETPEEPEQPKEPITGKYVDYPFRTGDSAFTNAMLWNGIKKASVDNWQTLTINFDATDMSNATYIAVQYGAKVNAPGMTYGLQNAGARYSIVGHNGEDIYVVTEDGKINLAARITFDASNIGMSGMLLIPTSTLSWQFGADADRDLTKIHQFIMTTNSFYNYDYEILIGEMGYYTGEVGEEDFTFHKLVDLTNGHQRDMFVCSSDDPSQVGRLSVNKIDQKVYGDTVLEVFGTNKQGSDYTIWEGGSYGEVTMGTDSYGDDAIVMKATGANPTGDSYTAITLADGIAYDWSDGKGVTLWVRNYSEGEISFNIQMDCLVDVTGDGIRDRGRFNVRQGYQVWLYDIKTGKDTIYMTRPEVTIPKGFEGWVRVPFGAFHQADWSLTAKDHEVIPRNYFMAEGSVVGYLAVTIHAPSYQDMTFAINKIGYYKTTPVLSTAIMTDDSKSIRKLMGLE